MEDFPQTKLLRYLYIRPIMLTYISSSWVKSTKTAVRGTACRGRLINPNPEPRKTLPTNSTGTNLTPYMAGLSENPARLFRGHKPFINFISLKTRLPQRGRLEWHMTWYATTVEPARTVDKRLKEHHNQTSVNIPKVRVGGSEAESFTSRLTISMTTTSTKNQSSKRSSW